MSPNTHRIPAPAEAAARPRHLQEEAYDRLAERFLALFRASRSHGFTAVWVALDLATQELASDGTLPLAQCRALFECASRDLSHLASMLVRGPRSAAHVLHRATREEGALLPLVNVLRLSGDAIYRLAGESGRAEMRRAGDVTCTGTLACVDCGHVRRSRQTMLVQPCTQCGSASGLKGFPP